MKNYGQERPTTTQISKINPHTAVVKYEKYLHKFTYAKIWKAFESFDVSSSENLAQTFGNPFTWVSYRQVD